MPYWLTHIILQINTIQQCNTIGLCLMSDALLHCINNLFALLWDLASGLNESCFLVTRLDGCGFTWDPDRFNELVSFLYVRVLSHCCNEARRFTVTSSRTPLRVSMCLSRCYCFTQACVGCTIHCFDCVKHISLLRHITAARQSLIGRQRFTTSSGKTMHTFFFSKVSHFGPHC